jgi:hypothetical protein
MNGTDISAALSWALPLLAVLLLWQSCAMPKGGYERDATQVLALLAALSWTMPRTWSWGTWWHALFALLVLAVFARLVLTVHRATEWNAPRQAEALGATDAETR